MNLSDEMLVTTSLQGDKKSLEQLIARYSGFVYNVSFKMLMNHDDSADITQEVLVKVITKLDSFKHNSSFKTWLYKITVNHILNFKKSAAVKRQQSFVQFGEMLDGAPSLDFAATDNYGADKRLLVEETKQTCMSAMLMCLDKRQRMVFILGEVFGVNDKVGSEILEISPENFRMILSRAKRDLYNFMDGKCGLVNKNNPCRCAKKTKAFINGGFVNPTSLRFAGDYMKTIEDNIGERRKEFDDLVNNDYRQLFMQHTYLQSPDFVEALDNLLSSDKVKKILNLK